MGKGVRERRKIERKTYINHLKDMIPISGMTKRCVLCPGLSWVQWFLKCQWCIFLKGPKSHCEEMIEGETRKLRVISDSHPRRFSVCSGKKVLTLYRNYKKNYSLIHQYILIERNQKKFQINIYIHWECCLLINIFSCYSDGFVS